MRVYITLFTTALICFSYSCKKKGNIPSSKGELTMKINGQTWSGIVNSKYNTKLSFGTKKYKQVEKNLSIPWETFGIGLFAQSMSKQPISKADSLINIDPQLASTYSSFGTVQDDGDVVCDLFEVLESDSLNNWIQITQEKNDYKEIWGNFSVTMYRTDGCTSSPYPDTLRIRDGNFHVYFD